MGFLRKLFSKKQEEKFDYEKIVDGISLKNAQDAVGKHSVRSANAEQELMESCESLMEKINHFRDEKREYDVDTGYFNDTELIDHLPEKDRQELAETAGSIISLTQTRRMYLNWESKNISKDRMLEFDRWKEDIPDSIQRLKSNESYQALVRHDLQKLEEEKNLWGYERSALKRRLKGIRTALITIGSIFVACVVVMGILTFSLKVDMTLPLLIAGLVVVISAFALYFMQQKYEYDLKQAEANLNRAITLLNRMKTKYVSVTNAVDYSYEKYKIHKASELEYLYNEYLKASKERESYERANEDLEYFNRVLVRQLSGYHLYDPSIWIYQANALYDPKEMVEVRHSILEHRQKIRERMDLELVEIRKEYEKLRELLKKSPQSSEEIKEILGVVEQLLIHY